MLTVHFLFLFSSFLLMVFSESIHCEVVLVFEVFHWENSLLSVVHQFALCRFLMSVILCSFSMSEAYRSFEYASFFMNILDNTMVGLLLED